MSSNLKRLIDAGHTAVKAVDTNGVTYWTEGKTYTVEDQKIRDDAGDKWGYNSRYGWPTSPTFAPAGGKATTEVTLDSIADSIVELVLKKLKEKLEEV